MSVKSSIQAQALLELFKLISDKDTHAARLKELIEAEERSEAAQAQADEAQKKVIEAQQAAIKELNKTALAQGELSKAKLAQEKALSAREAEIKVKEEAVLNTLAQAKDSRERASEQAKGMQLAEEGLKERIKLLEVREGKIKVKEEAVIKALEQAKLVESEATARRDKMARLAAEANAA